MMIERVHRDTEIIEAIWAATLAAECAIRDMQAAYNKRVRTRRYPATEPIQTAQEIIL